MKVKIDPEFKQLIQPLAPHERHQLETNLLEQGCLDPLIVWRERNILLDGHNRYQICEEHNIKYQIQLIELSDRRAAKVWIINNQFGRRNLTPYQRGELALQLEGLLKVKAKENQKLSKGRGQKGSQTSVNLLDTQKELATIAKTSHDTIAKIKYLNTHADEDIKQQLRSGNTSINSEYTKLKRQERTAAAFAKVKNDITNGGTRPTIELADCLDWLPRQPQCDLLLTDPPYSTDVDNFEAFVKSWLPLALSKLKSTGRAYIFVGAYPRELQTYLNTALPEQILIWSYKNTMGPNPKYNYFQNYQAILYYKMPEAAPLNTDLLIEKISVHESNHPARSDERLHSWQKPLGLAEMFVKHSTNPGDLVLDPFACTGTFLIASGKFGRLAKGCEINNTHLQIAIERGVDVCQHRKEKV